MTSTTASAIRPSLRDNRQLSGSPHTPSRFISSNYSSPGSTFRQEEDAVIFDLDSRCLRAGFEGESGPQCTITFGPENSRRVGDYQTWLPDYKRAQIKMEDATKQHELWRNDLHDVDLGLLEDKLERGVRELYNKHLLTDAGTARLILVLPSVVPLPVISSILTTLFERWKYATITLLPAPTMNAVAAGVRSALVVELGWEETVITPVYEYRELPALRTARAMKRLTFQMGEKLQAVSTKRTVTDGQSLRHDFDFVEDFISRVASCELKDDVLAKNLADGANDISLNGTGAATDADTISIEWPTQTASHTVQVSRHEISKIVRDCFLGDPREERFDDHEQPLNHLLFHSLLYLPPDIRGLCMSRIIFTGAGAAVRGLKDRVLAELEASINSHGWTAIRGQHVKSTRRGLAEIAQGRAAPDARHNVSLPAGKDYVEEKLQKQSSRNTQSTFQGSLRSIDSLGAWTGASLLATLKVKSFVEIERERFLSHGISGATREAESSVAPQRMSSFGVGATKSSDRSSWTLGIWG